MDGTVSVTASPHHLYHPPHLASLAAPPQALERCLHAQPCEASLLGQARFSNVIFWAACSYACEALISEPAVLPGRIRRAGTAGTFSLVTSTDFPAHVQCRLETPSWFFVIFPYGFSLLDEVFSTHGVPAQLSLHQSHPLPSAYSSFFVLQ